MKEQLPPAAREKYQEIEALQDDAEAVVAKKRDAEDRLSDAEAALEALAEVDDETLIVRSVGRVRLPADPEETTADLEAEVDRLETRIETLETRKEELAEAFEDRKREIKHLLGVPGDSI